MRHWVVNSAVPLTLAVGGTIALVFSWGYEKQEHARASEEVTRLQRSQLVIQLDEVARDQWIIAFNQELTKSAPNPELLAITANNALVNLVTWQSHMEMRVAKSSEEYRNTVAGREAVIAQAKRHADEKNYSALAKALQTFQEMSRASNTTLRLDNEFFARVDAVNTKLAEVEARMRWLYILGTGALLLSSVLSNVLSDRSFRRIEQQMVPRLRNRR